MSHAGMTTFTKYEMMAIVTIASLGLTAIVAVGGGGRLSPMIFILGFFILLPLIYVIGDRFPFVESPTHAEETQMTPVEALRNQYATGEMNYEEFERRLDHLMESEGHPDAGNKEIKHTAQSVSERE